VRAAPNRARVANRQVSPWGEKWQRQRSEGDEDRGDSVTSVDERQDKEGSMDRSRGHGRRRARGEREERATW
jgi:hypothetical protein